MHPVALPEHTTAGARRRWTFTAGQVNALGPMIRTNAAGILPDHIPHAPIVSTLADALRIYRAVAWPILWRAVDDIHGPRGWYAWDPPDATDQDYDGDWAYIGPDAIDPFAELLPSIVTHEGRHAQQHGDFAKWATLRRHTEQLDIPAALALLRALLVDRQQEPCHE